MADRKISELTNITGANIDDANDEIAIVDTSASETKAITREELFKDIDGNITLSGTVDGRDVATDGSKLDGIESNATADQTASEIKTAYESNADTNAFTDAEQTKLSSVETNADVTDTANVTAAGALMDSELTSEASVKALDQGVATTDSPDFAGLSVDTDTLYVDSASNRVGIGTSSPGEKLTIKSGIGNDANILEVTGINLNRGLLLGVEPSSGGTGEAAVVYDAQTFNGEHVFKSNGSEAMRIDSSGNVGIGTSSPGAPLQVAGLIRSIAASGSNGFQVGDFGSDAGTFKVEAVSGRSLTFVDDFAGSERMRIDSGGNLLVGKTVGPTDYSQAGVSMAGAGFLSISRSSDATLMQFASGGSVEGSISVSGTTVSYNGGHLSRWSRLPEGTDDTHIYKGTVMTNLEEMCEWRDEQGDLEDNEQLNKTTVSTQEGDPNVAGLFVTWDEDDDWGDYYLAMTGDLVIRIAQGVTVQRGDLLMSAGDGTAKPQGDDIVRSKTVAKVTSTNISHTYPDGSYAVPCVVMAC